jgi:hypothetical protein
LRLVGFFIPFGWGVLMRPAGDIREAARAAAWEAAANRGDKPGVSWRDLESRLAPQGVGRSAVKHTVKNMARSGELSPAGWVRVPGVSRSLRAYLPVTPAAAAEAARRSPHAGALDQLGRALFGRG